MRFTFVILLFCCLGADAQMIIKAHPNYVPFASANLLLDQYSGAAAAYSLRKLRTAYTGSAIRVRRSNDNSEQDIGFTTQGNLDTTALKTFVGANSGFVTTWYDQSGNARNAIQNTAANQPRIINAGDVERQNGKPSVFLDGTDMMTLTDFSLPTSSIFAAAITTGTSPSALDIHGIYARGNNRTPNSASRDAFLYVWRNNNRGEIQRSNGVTFPTAVVTATAANFNLYTGIFTGTQLIAYANGTAGTPVNTTISGTVSNGVSSIGCVFESSTTNYFFVGRISEIIVYASGQSSNRTQIETNINSYYGIY
jgi:hypothetical protein